MGAGYGSRLHARQGDRCDDVVFTGSYNLSRSGMGNAENVLEIHDAGIAERLCEFIDSVRERYPLPPLPFD